MKKTNLFKLFRTLPALLMFLPYACTDESLTTENEEFPTVPGGMATLELHTNAEEYQAPATRTGSASENAIGSTPWILVFRGNNDDATFVEAAQAFVIGSASYVTLTKTTQESKVIVIANPPVTFYNGTAEVDFNAANLNAYLTANPRLGEAVNGLLTAQLATPNQATVPYTATSGAAPTLPMTGQATLFSIAAGTTIGTSTSKLMLKRIVAKVIVESANIASFSFNAATVVNTPRSGRLYQSDQSTLKDNTGNLTDYLTSTTGDEVTGIAVAVSNSTSVNPIYVYESRKEENASVIIKGNYFGATLYYKLAFNDTKGAIDVLRNKSYKFTISAVPSGEGYPTVAEAKANPPSNIRYQLEVTDQTSSDILDNGVFYLGLSNSEFYLYDDAAVSGTVIALTITTNATAGMDFSGNSISATTTVGTAFSVSPSTITLATTPGTTATTDVRVTIPAYTTSTTGSINLRLGNLTKFIRFVRSASYTPIAYPANFSTTTAAGKVTSQGTGGANWLTLSTDGVTPGGTDVALSEPANLYILASNNLTENSGVARTGGEVYITRTGALGRIKVAINQRAAIIGQNSNTTRQYVGAFYRWNQTGERLIRIPNSGINGAWTAQVIKGDFIVLDTSPTSDTGVTYDASTENPADMNDPVNDATYRVESSQKIVRGAVAVSTDFIQFRIGLTGTLPGGSTGTPRYGLIALAFNGNARYIYIYVRQGEGADYVMRPEDAISSGGMSSSTRPLARKFSPYNLTDPSQGTGLVDRGTRGYTFTDYPSQAGYYFQWGSTTAGYPTGIVTGWNTTATTGYWADNSSWETCPAGYHHPNDGSTSAAVNPATTTANVSEIRQSLWLNPASVVAQDVNTNTIYGFYADGFFDRRAQVSSANGSTFSTTSSGVTIAYTGRLFFNPATRASVFFPSAGQRNSAASSVVSSTGSSGMYWTSSGSGTSGVYNSLSAISLGANTLGFPVRCVADQ